MLLAGRGSEISLKCFGHHVSLAGMFPVSRFALSPMFPDRAGSKQVPGPTKGLTGASQTHNGPLSSNASSTGFPSAGNRAMATKESAFNPPI